jgi:hypothetical protein
MLRELRSFKKRHGHCNVPTKFPANPRLGRWVAARRYKRKLGELTDKEIAALDTLGFVWSVSDFSWQSMLEALVRFKRQHGHCNVPENWKSNRRLANWVQSQRHRKRRGKLSPERVKSLEAVGFTWAIYKCVEATPPRRGGRRREVGSQDRPQEKLYWLRNGLFVQHDGKCRMPPELEAYLEEHGGEYPPHIPLPAGPTHFLLGIRYVNEKRVPWPGRGKLPAEVLRFVKRTGTLPPYD